jgi:hypothetical protein
MPIARASLATADPIELPSDAATTEYNLQWMPPGRQDINCWVDKKPRQLSFTVTPDLADKFNEQLQAMLLKAQDGKGDRPFTDYNHEDREASSRPTRIIWGGNDAKKGGIRLIGKWTSKARSAIRDEEFERFSPQWDFDENTGTPLGITVNLGGLVNKAAFKSIAKAEAGDASQATGSTDELQNHPFVVQSRNLAAEKGITPKNAQIELARRDYPLYQKYLTACSRASIKKTGEAKAVNAGRENFLNEVRSRTAHGISVTDAISSAAASRPELYDEYRRSFMGNPRR